MTTQFFIEIESLEVKRLPSVLFDFLQHHLWDRTNKTRPFVSEKLPILFLKIPPLFMSSFPLQNHSAAVFHCHRCFVHHLRCHSEHSRSSPPLTIVDVDATAVRLPEWGDASYNAASHPPPRPTGPTTSGAPTRLLSCLLLRTAATMTSTGTTSATTATRWTGGSTACGGGARDVRHGLGNRWWDGLVRSASNSGFSLPPSSSSSSQRRLRRSGN